MVRRSNRLYNKIKELLINFPELRDSDKKLLWKIWEYEGYVFCGTINYERFVNYKCTTPETITRCRRKLQELYPELRGSQKVQSARRKKQQSKGTFVYREVIDPATNKVISYVKENADTAAAVS